LNKSRQRCPTLLTLEKNYSKLYETKTVSRQTYWRGCKYPCCCGFGCENAFV